MFRFWSSHSKCLNHRATLKLTVIYWLFMLIFDIWVGIIQKDCVRMTRFGCFQSYKNYFMSERSSNKQMTYDNSIQSLWLMQVVTARWWVPRVKYLAIEHQTMANQMEWWACWMQSIFQFSNQIWWAFQCRCLMEGWTANLREFCVLFPSHDNVRSEKSIDWQILCWKLWNLLSISS
jgi:hypothetical protein